MNNKEINIEIAKLLGFEQYQDNSWYYPKEWDKFKASIPCHSIPDFVQILKNYKHIVEMNEFGIPKQFNHI